MSSKIKKIIAIIGAAAIISGIWKINLYYNSYGAAASKARDEKRMEDFQNFKMSLMLYFSEHKVYPRNLSDLLPRYLAEISQDPLEGKKHGSSECESAIGKNIFSYDYQQIDFGKKFTLAACLEEGKILMISQ